MALTIDGRAPRAGEIFRNPGLARTLRIVAEGGKAGVLRGRDRARHRRGRAGTRAGCSTRTTWRRIGAPGTSRSARPIAGIRVWECPPNGQGLAALLALNMLEGSTSRRSTRSRPTGCTSRSRRCGSPSPTRAGIVADPAFSPAPLDALLSKAYAAERRKLIDPKRGRRWTAAAAAPPVGSDTVYLTVVDGEGNACSFINSNYMGFGTGIVPSRRGFTLQNRGHNFTLDPAHPNALAPRKRPYHTIIPAGYARHRPGRAALEELAPVRQLRRDGRVHAAAGPRAGALGLRRRRRRPAGRARPAALLHHRPGAARGAGGAGEWRWKKASRPETLPTLQEMGHPVSLVTGIRPGAVRPRPDHPARPGDRRPDRRQRPARRRLRDVPVMSSRTRPGAHRESLRGSAEAAAMRKAGAPVPPSCPVPRLPGPHVGPPGRRVPGVPGELRAPPVTGLRANTLKITPQTLMDRLPFDLTPVPWSPEAFVVAETER